MNSVLLLLHLLLAFRRRRAGVAAHMRQLLLGDPRRWKQRGNTTLRLKHHHRRLIGRQREMLLIRLADEEHLLPCIRRQGNRAWLDAATVMRRCQEHHRETLGAGKRCVREHLLMMVMVFHAVLLVLIGRRNLLGLRKELQRRRCGHHEVVVATGSGRHRREDGLKMRRHELEVLRRKNLNVVIGLLALKLRWRLDHGRG